MGSTHQCYLIKDYHHQIWQLTDLGYAKLFRARLRTGHEKYNVCKVKRREGIIVRMEVHKMLLINFCGFWSNILK